MTISTKETDEMKIRKKMEDEAKNKRQRIKMRKMIVMRQRKLKER